MESSEFMQLSDKQKMGFLVEDWESLSDSNLYAIACRYAAMKNPSASDAQVMQQILAIFAERMTRPR